MLQLPNNCRAGKISVYPTNWKTVRADVKLTWYIKYRFYDDNLKKSKQVVIKGMNDLSTLKEKQGATQILLDDEMDLLLNEGFNRITGAYHIEVAEDITRHTPFIEALNFAFDRIKAGTDTIANLKSCLAYMTKAADQLRYTKVPISEIKVRHIILLLERTGKIKKETKIITGKKGQFKQGIWTSNTFNQYRANLGILFKFLVKLEVCDANYPLVLDKEKNTRKIRETLTKEQRAQINTLLFEKDRNFWRFLHIFFHSGSREVEMLRLKAGDVDIKNQRFKALVKKGRSYREEWRTIKTVVLNLWQEVLSLAKPNDYLFHVGLVPGSSDKPIRTEQVSKRWLRHVKKPLGITADFYSLKHSNLDETAELLSIQEASKAAGHSSTVVTMEHYLTGEKERQHNRLKKVNNSF